MSTTVRGADIVVQALREAGVRYVFGVTGNTVLDVLDSLYDTDIEFITTHQERVAVAMADGYARTTGQLGVVLFHVGPGVAAALTGVLDARKDGTPLLVLTGNLHRSKLGWDSWHEMDVMQIMKGFTKHNRQFTSLGEIPGVMREAVHKALSPRQGPVHIDMPQDLLEALVPAHVVSDRILHRQIAACPEPESAAIATASQMLATARRPILVCGEGATACGAGTAVQALAEFLQAPVVTTETARGLLPEDHPLSLSLVGHGGNSTANRALRESDLVVGLGCRFGNFMTINDALISSDTRLLQVETAPEEISSRLRTDLALVGDVGAFAHRVQADLATAGGGSVDREWTQELCQAWRQEMERFFETDLNAGPVKPQRIIRDVMANLDRDAIVVTGCGYHQHWANKVPVRAARSFLQAAGSGALGWALGAAAGAKLAHPDRQVVALIGDGDFSSVLPDLETAVRCRLGVVYIIMNDNGYGALRLSQKRSYRGRFIGNDFANPDFGQVAKLYGAEGVQISNGRDLEPAVQAALERRNQPTVIDVLIDDQEPYYRASEFGLFHQPVKM